MNKNISILDCTLRDGGLGLEDAYKNKLSDISFSHEDNDAIIRNLNRTNLDIIEIGSIEISDDDKTRFAIYQDVKAISALIPADRNPETADRGRTGGCQKSIFCGDDRVKNDCGPHPLRQHLRHRRL